MCRAAIHEIACQNTLPTCPLPVNFVWHSTLHLLRASIFNLLKDTVVFLLCAIAPSLCSRACDGQQLMKLHAKILCLHAIFRWYLYSTPHCTFFRPAFSAYWKIQLWLYFVQYHEAYAVGHMTGCNSWIFSCYNVLPTCHFPAILV